MSNLSPSSRSLHRTLYYSRALIAPAGMAEAVDAIIRRSIANNRDDAITGLLFVHQGWFLQALEGPAEAVQTTLGRVGRDDRHTDLKVIVTGPVQSRLFSDWDMCARTLSMVDEAMIDTFDRRGAFDPGQLSPSAALRLLTTLRAIRQDAQLRFVA